MLPPAPPSEPSLDFRFARTALDRRADLRDDVPALAALAADPRARTLVTSGSRVVVARRPDGGLEAALDGDLAARLAPSDAEPIFLGTDAGVGWFALPLADPERATAAGLELIELRALAIAGTLPDTHYGALAAARALLHWHEGHRFCARCGAASRPTSAGWKRVCPSCSTEHFPRTDPVVIMLVEDGERCLLGRGHGFPEGMWSCLAGFMEPGETIEGAVRRETLEEAGIAVGAIAYVASEPWPFPGSLMIGVRAQALDREIRIDPKELADCRWFDRDEARLLLDRRHPDGLVAPPPIAIAHHLMRTFVETR
jgi:NAD+ diphosphatase